MTSRFVWMDGRLVPFEQATVHFLNPALHYGLAVFEGVRAYDTPRGPAIFRLREHSVRLGFDEAIMLDPYGFVAECTGENLFLVREGKIRTPDSATVLEGITRDSLLTIARDLGYEIVEGPVSRDQLYAADEVFVCGTA